MKSTFTNYKVVIYFILTFIIFWGAIQLLIGLQNIPGSSDQVQLIGIGLLLGPFLSSLILTAINDGKNGIRNLLSRVTVWKIDIRWYLFVILFVPIIFPYFKNF